MADLSKLRFNGTDYNVKDASAPKRKLDNTYAKTSNLPITSDDTIQSAIGKLENAHETNQSNIWYALNDGVKNLFPINSGSVSGAGYLNKNNEHGEVLVYPIPAGSYKLKWTVSSTATNCGFQIIFADDDVSVAANRISTTTRTVTNTTTTFTDDITIPSGKTATHLVFYINNVGSVSNVMLCRADLYSQDSTYVPYALPNHDLTRLEAEDRAALADVVDNGAKNLLRGCSNSSTAGTATVQTDSYIVKLTGSAQPGSVAFTERCIIEDSGVYKLKLDLSGTFSSVGLWDLDADTSIIDKSSSGTYDVSLTSGHRYCLFHYTSSSKTLNATIKFMLCKPVKYQMSSDIVPYQYQTKNVFCEYKRITSSTSLVSSGISYTAESNGVYRFTALAANSNSVPQELAIYHRQSGSGSAYLLTEANQQSGNNNSLVISGIVLCQTGGILSLSSRYSTSAINTHGLLVEKVFDMASI